MVDPDMGTWSYAYDAAGNLLRQGDDNDNVLCFYYDDLNRLTRQIEDSSPTTPCPTSPSVSGPDHLASYTYINAGNGIGQVGAVSWGPTPTQNKDVFSYDSLGRLTQQVRYLDNRPYSLTPSNYDIFHRPLTMTYPNGDVTNVSYDHEGENTLTLTSTNPDEVLVEKVTYNARGQIEFLDRNNAIPNTAPDTWYTYGSASNNFRLEQIKHGSSGSDNRPDFDYEYDDLGNITRLTSTVSTTYYGTDVQEFTYDSLNRLVRACTLDANDDCTTNTTNGHYNQTFVYDSLGNITNFAGQTYTYQDVDHAHAVTHINGGSPKFVYDDNGNMLTRIEGGVTYTQNFDVQNRLTSVVTSGQTTSFSYDASGFRVKTVEPNGTVIYTPFPNYEEEIRPAGQSSYGNGSGIMAAPAVGNTVDAASASSAQETQSKANWG